MSRPTKCRLVAFMPGVTYFKPAGIPLRYLEEVQLTVEEAESIRLKDVERLEQRDCAGKMDISRPTFQRILASARRKTAEALLNGKAIRIEGGHFDIAPVQVTCSNGHEWQTKYDYNQDTLSLCPTCGLPSNKTKVTGCCRRAKPNPVNKDTFKIDYFI